MAEIGNNMLVFSKQFHTILEEKKWDEIIASSKLAVDYMKRERERFLMPECFFDHVKNILIDATNIFSKHLDAESENYEENIFTSYQVLTESYKCLRNACVECARNQNILAGSVTDQTEYILKTILNNKRDVQQGEQLILLRCVVQFLGNLAVNNAENQLEIIQIYQKYFRALLVYKDDKLFDYTCAVIHVCLAGATNDVIASPLYVETVQSTFLPIVEHLVSGDSIFGVFCLEDMLTKCDVLPDMFSNLAINGRLYVLELILSLKTKDCNDTDAGTLQLSEQNIRYISEDFKINAHEILSLVSSDVDEMHHLALVKELEILCAATSHSMNTSDIKNDKDVLKQAINLLKSVHEVGQTGKNSFTRVDKLSQENSIDTSHPAYGLKRDCIRLIGNMVHNNTANQDMVRELDGIPLILDQTSIDRTNPFITEWSILTIRNLCDGNNANKQVLAELKIEGVANSVGLLEECGMSAEVVEGKVVVKSGKG